MALPSQLTRFKAPGVKFITDVVESTPTAEAPQGARVLVINSRKGSVNSLILVRTENEYFSIFDSVSDADERRGNWSARSASYMLAIGPIYVINLRTFDNEIDLAGLQELSTVANVVNGTAKQVPYTSLYNTQQFWKIDPSQLLSQTNTDKLLTFANIGVSSLSVFVRKSRQPALSTLTFERWYTTLGREMPAYLLPQDKVSDYVVDVMIFENKFDASSAANASYGFCFNTDGTVKDTVVNGSGQTVDALTQLSRLPESGFMSTVTGSLVQGFTDEFGTPFDIVRSVNELVQQTGLVAKLNDELFDAAAIWSPGETVLSNGQKKPVPVDFAGHTMCNITSTGTFDLTAFTALSDVLAASYSFAVTAGEIKQTFDTFDQLTRTTDENSTVLAHTAQFESVMVGSERTANRSKVFVIDNIRPDLGDRYVSVDGNLASIIAVNVIGEIDKIWGYGTVLAPVQPYGDDTDFAQSHDWEDADGQDSTFTYANAGVAFPLDGGGDYFVYPADHVLTGLPLMFDTATGAVVHNPIVANVGDYTAQTVDGTTYPLDFTDLPIAYAPTGTSQLITLTDISKARVQDDDATNTTTKYQALLTRFGVKESVFTVTFDKQLVANSDQGQGVNTKFDPISNTGNNIELTSGQLVATYQAAQHIFKVNSFDNSVDQFVPTNLKAYTARTAQFLDGTATRQNDILDLLLGDLKGALANQDLFSFNYIVDGFKSYIEPNVKSQLKEVAAARILCRAIYSMPSIYDFQRSTNPYFRSRIDGRFEPRFIALGGNLQLPYSNSFSLPSENGYYAYGFGPNILLSDGKLMPPAALVSNLFARKYTNGAPYATLAGPGEGSITGSGVAGVEYVFNESNDGNGDRDFLDPFGYNVILRKTATGLQIYGNRTSNNTVESALSSIHTSEIVMYIQERVKSLLERFVFKYNTAQNRLVIKEEADGICAEPLGDGAISGFTNQMDDLNNTGEVIRNRIGILDTKIIANNGMEILVHRTTIDTETNTAQFEVL